MRGGVDGVGASTPQLIPASILRKNFEFIAMIKPHEVPNRPEFYMIGSGITEAFLNALTIGATCTHEDWRAPCFTTGEIRDAIKQLKAEQSAFDELTVEEQAAHTAAGGLAVASPRFITTHTFPGDVHHTNSRSIFAAFRTLAGEGYEGQGDGVDACTHPEFGPMSHWDVSEVTDMTDAFKGDTGKNGIGWFWKHLDWSASSCDISKWDTSEVTNMQRMFQNSGLVLAADGSGNPSYMLRNEGSFNVDLSAWKTGKVTSMDSMFRGLVFFNGKCANAQRFFPPQPPFISPR